MKLFESTVTPAVLYGSSCWTMWADTERLLRTNRRRMLRLMVGARRRPNETWVEYMQRSTWRSEELAAKYKLTDECDLQRKRKQQMVQKSENYAVRPLASPHTQMDAVVSHKTQQEVRDVPRSDGAIYRICNFLSICMFLSSFQGPPLCWFSMLRICAKCAWVFLVWIHPTKLSLCRGNENPCNDKFQPHRLFNSS